MSELNSDFHRLQYAQYFLDLLPYKSPVCVSLIRMHLAHLKIGLGRLPEEQSALLGTLESLQEQFDCLEATIGQILKLLPALQLDPEALAGMHKHP